MAESGAAARLKGMGVRPKLLLLLSVIVLAALLSASVMFVVSDRQRLQIKTGGRVPARDFFKSTIGD